MPRRFLKKVLPNRQELAERWFMRPFRSISSDPVYWSAHRRGVLRAFALGLFINFIPVPVHLVLAPLAAIVLRVNLPVTMVTVLLVNPLTALPTFLTAYWVGAQLLNEPMTPFQFAMSWEWITEHLKTIWKPLLLGCFVLGVTAAIVGYLLLSLIWRLQVSTRFRNRPWKLRRGRSRVDEDPPL